MNGGTAFSPSQQTRQSAWRVNAALEGVRRAGASQSVQHDLPTHPDTERIIAKVHSSDYERELEEACRSGMRARASAGSATCSQTLKMRNDFRF